MIKYFIFNRFDCLTHDILGSFSRQIGESSHDQLGGLKRQIGEALTTNWGGCG